MDFVLPPVIRELIVARNKVRDHYASSGLSFTLDGNLVGDLGEALAADLFGLKLIVDMGTGVNTQIISTSTFWRFDFFSGLILIALTLPLNYILAKTLGGIGPAVADLFTFAVYNILRCLFLYHKFRMQPFTMKSLYTLLLGGVCYIICWRLFDGRHGLGWTVGRSLVFLGLYGGGVLTLHLSEDILPVWNTILKRVKWKK